MSAASEPELLVHWERTLGDLLDRTARFPKLVRFTFAARMEGLGLDVLECLVRARYAAAGEQDEQLARADGHLAVLRALVRLSHDRRFLPRSGLEVVSTNLDEAGRMLGGWRRHLASSA